MFNAGSLVRPGRIPVLMLVLAAAMLSGCESKQDKALDQAKQQAAATGQPQQVVSVDKNGTTTTTVVQPPAQGQTGEAIATASAPPAAGAPIPAPSGPTVSAVAATGQRQHPGGNHAGHPHRSTHQRQGQPRRRHVYRRDRGPVLAGDNTMLVPKGAAVGGVVDVSHRRGHFKGRSTLELRLTSLTLDGTRYPLQTRDMDRSKKGKGRRSAAMIGGGAGWACWSAAWLPEA